jgi:predicted ATPase with chaperone activity
VSLALEQPQPIDDSSGYLTTPPQRSKRFMPPEITSIEDCGIPQALLEQLILKYLYFKGDLVGKEVAQMMGFRFSLIQDLMETFKVQQLLQVKGSRGLGPVSATFALTEAGRRVARDYLETNQYVGPAPVPLQQYEVAVGMQALPNHWLSYARLAEAYAHVVISERVLNQIGPAVSSGKSFLIYGQPGNGKTYMAEALSNIQTSPIWLPFALEYQGNIIQLFDSSHHKPFSAGSTAVSTEELSDGRWARCRRPFIASGGELSLNMLDLSYNPVAKTYDAPLQLKANNGIYLIDDFGRQRATPTEILNRWIIPMERHMDYLTFAHGTKMTVPFESFLIFSTNLTPDQLGDEAFLRRIQYKMLLQSPDRLEFRAIFLQQCEKHGMQPDGHLIDKFILKYYTRTGRAFRRCHPRDLLSLVSDYIAFKRLPDELTEDLLDHAFECCFMTSTELVDS